MKKLLLFIAALPIILFAAGCSKEEKPDTDTPKIRMMYRNEDAPGNGVHQSIADFTIAGKKVEADYMTSVEITASENTPFTFSVKKSAVLVGEFPDEIYPYSGTISRSLFTALETDYNSIKFSISNLVPTMTINSVPVAVVSTGGGGNGGGGNPYKGIWVRQLGASGDETDLAIGTIPGEPANAVWMCEYKGDVGLYKGTISGSTITFDPQYGLPTYTVKIEDGQLWLKGNISNSLFTPYEKGTWTAHCGTLGN